MSANDIAVTMLFISGVAAVTGGLIWWVHPGAGICFAGLCALVLATAGAKKRT